MNMNEGKVESSNLVYSWRETWDKLLSGSLPNGRLSEFHVG